MPGIACHQQRGRQSDDLGGGNWGIERVIHIIQISRMGTKIRHRVGIGDDQPGSPADDGKCGQPVVSLRQLSREQTAKCLFDREGNPLAGCAMSPHG